MKIDEYGMYNGYTIAEEIEQKFFVVRQKANENRVSFASFHLFL